MATVAEMNATTSMTSNAEIYECCICELEYPFEEGVATCAAHFFDNECLAMQFQILASQPGFDGFPARCCFNEATEVKKCPKCRMVIEHKEACNHMACVYCQHEFCWVCFLPWISHGYLEGCPNYGDPEYDEEDYRVVGNYLIHRFMGLDREAVMPEGPFLEPSR